MVHFTFVRFCSNSARQGTGRGHQNWIDSLRLYCKAGTGGHGTPKYGGLGGRGGSVIIKTSDKAAKNKNPLKTMQDVFKKTFKGQSKNQRLVGGIGEESRKTRLVGAPGTDATLIVPNGVSISDDSGHLLKDLNEEGQEFIACSGGQGGCPATGFIGLPGQRRHIRLELKLLADVGLVGFPNAGKSTLLNAISRARPKIASYPFTTIKPNLGHIEYMDMRVITMADLPGLIEGAHYNVGMGHRFLKHVERTKLLLLVVDVNGFQLKPETEFRSAFQTVALLNRELELYNPDLLKKPAMLIANKMDLPGSEKNLRDLEDMLTNRYDEALLEHLDEDCWPEQRIAFRDIIPISAKEDPRSVRGVKAHLRTCLDQIEDEQRKADEEVAALSNELEDFHTTKTPVIS